MTQPDASQERMRVVKLVLVLTAVTAVGFLSACTGQQMAIRSDANNGPVYLYSDAQFQALKTQPPHIDDLARAPQGAVSLTPNTKLDVLGTEQVSVRSDVAPPVAWPFDHVRVASGPAAGREGWISDRRIVDGQQLLVPSQ